MTPSTRQSIVMLSVTYAECRYAECRYAECGGAPGQHFQPSLTFTGKARVQAHLRLSVVMLNVVMLSVVAPNRDLRLNIYNERMSMLQTRHPANVRLG